MPPKRRSIGRLTPKARNVRQRRNERHENNGNNDGNQALQTPDRLRQPLAVLATDNGNAGDNTPGLPDAHVLSTMSVECNHCSARLFAEETKSLCCGNGKVSLPPLQDPPDLLKSLLTETSPEAKHFRSNIRAFNASLAFASLGVSEDILPPGVYTFRIHGAVHHRIGQLLPEGNARPAFAQIYIHDTDNETANRCAWNAELHFGVMQNLQEMLHTVSPFIRQFLNAAEQIRLAGDRGGEVRMVLKADCTKDSRRYNLPTASEIAVLLPGDDNIRACPRDIVLYRRPTDHPQGASIMHIYECHPHYDPLHYVLLFPRGEDGWRTGIAHQGNRMGQITPMEFYAYRVMDRGHFSTLHHSGRLFQQYVVDQFAKMEQQRLKFLRFNQTSLRAELYQGLADAVAAGDTDGTSIGRKVILPASYTGSPRNMMQLYQDAMSIVRAYGKPDLFVTFTCNPSWPEIKRELKGQQEASNRPDLIARIFKLKLQSLMNDILKKKIFGPVIAYVRVIEFQKRGLPHTHMLLILDSEHKPRTVEDVDNIVKAELPSDPALKDLVKTHMLHGPCGTAFPNSPCMVDGKCSKEFPKNYAESTSFTSSSYPKYKRPCNGLSVDKKGVSLDNKWVVPYNPYLLSKYRAHINVEVCNSVTAVKYLYKYVYKGHDRVMVHFTTSDDEIKRYVDARYVSASEACWRLFHFDMQERYPAIQRLALHLPDQQSVVYREGQAENALAARKNTTLLAWFEANKEHEAARNLFYHEMPEHFVWDKTACCWKPRQRDVKCIGRLYCASPAEGERFYLRVLLHSVKGATSFNDLKTLRNGQLAQSFKEACYLRGLLESDEEWKVCLQEASQYSMPTQMRQLFAMLLVFCEPAQPLLLWQQFEIALTEDYLHRKFHRSHAQPDQVCSDMGLHDIDKILRTHNKSLEDYSLPQPHAHSADTTNEDIWNAEEQRQKAEACKRRMNEDQVAAFNQVMEAILSDTPHQLLFFINGAGGTGKTFLYNTLLAEVRGRGLTALAMASSGIASELLDGGRTAHSTFKIPIPITASSMCSISRGSETAAQIRTCSLMIWDEAPMMDKQVFECVDRSCQDIMGNTASFGGKVVVLGGDFRQVLPVVRHGSEGDIISATLKSSYLWQHVKLIKLTQNMRANSDDGFDTWLLRVGNGTEPTVPNSDRIQLPPQVCLPPNADIDGLVSAVFDDTSEASLISAAILTTTNDYVDQLNDKILRKLPTPERLYLSADSVCDTENPAFFPTDFLNSLNLSGLPPHVLRLKVGAPAMLLRNLSPKQGLLNGTRILITKLGDRVIEGRLLTGRCRGQFVFIPRITLSPSDSGLPFTLRRRQFPLRTCFAMTVNKSQGQTLGKVGIYLPEPVFTHGQLYVALSRAKNFHSITVLVPTKGQTRNVVYKTVI